MKSILKIIRLFFLNSNLIKKSIRFTHKILYRVYVKIKPKSFHPRPFINKQLNNFSYYTNYVFIFIKSKSAWNNIPKNDDNKVRIHLGCGQINSPKFINIDVQAYKHIHYLSRVEKLPFLKSEMADLIYVSHCLEHISHLELKKTLSEWHRILKPGGILRLSVPDFDVLLNKYIEQGRDISSVIDPLMGGQNYKYNFHYSVFNFNYLESLLIDVGFAEVRPWVYGYDEFSSLPDWSGRLIRINDKEIPISLNVEGVR